MNSPACSCESLRSNSSSGVSVTRRASPSENSRPNTATVCSNSFSSTGSRSIRDPSTACTVVGYLNRVHRLGKPHHPVALQRAIFEEGLHNLLHEEGGALGPFADQPFERDQVLSVAQQRRKHLRGALASQRVEAQLRVVRFAVPQ